MVFIPVDFHPNFLDAVIGRPPPGIFLADASPAGSTKHRVPLLFPPFLPLRPFQRRPQANEPTSKFSAAVVTRRLFSIFILLVIFLLSGRISAELIRPLDVSDTVCCDAQVQLNELEESVSDPVEDISLPNEGTDPLGALAAATKGGEGESPEAATKMPPVNVGVKILILGDSMSLAGFGERLDSRLRKMPGVASVNTYMACGANPLSWLKKKPYATTKTRCGYWSIEGSSVGKAPEVIKDVYGMRKGHRPSSRRVPKLEDLIAKYRPDILVFQSGNNLFGCFKNKRTISKKTHSQAIRWYVDPFVKEVSKPGTSLKKFYWVSPPEAGCVTPEIQAFLYDRISELAKPVGSMIDSRKLTSYPYRMMGPDKEHFWGPEADKWSDDVFDIISADLQSQSLKKAVTLDLKAKAGPAETAPSQSTQPDVLRVLARLSKVTLAPAVETFAPYHELLVGYRYEVEKVLEGKLEDQAVLLMHPAFIKLQAQDLSSYEVGKSYEFGLRMMDESSLWGGVRNRDDTDSFELMPYLLTSDESRHPDAKGEVDEQQMPPKASDGNHVALASHAAGTAKPDQTAPLVMTVPGDAKPDVAARKPLVSAKVVPKNEAQPIVEAKLKILFLGESMSLMGLGPRLDSHLRELPEIASVNTYMTCGTNPRSWLKGEPYAKVKTRCGYWSIESRPGDARPGVVKDIYGMKRGHRPSARLVPKLEDLVAKYRPDILVYQGGSAIFSCFKDKRTIRKKSHSKAISWYIDPFIKEVSRPGTSLKKFYWITPPQAGSVTTEIQAFLYDQFSELAGPVARMIDSRELTSYPYRRMAPDKEQFWGDESDKWTDDVFEIIKADLRAKSLEEVATLDVKAIVPVVDAAKALTVDEPEPQILNTDDL